MKNIFIIVLLLTTAVFTHAQSLLGLEDVMKNKVGAPFKIVFLHVVKQGQIDPAGSTLLAAQTVQAGLREGLMLAPSQLLNENGQLKDEDSKIAFREYQKGMQAMIMEVGKLIEILSARMDEAAKIDAAKMQVQVIIRAQKQAHEQHKEE